MYYIHVYFFKMSLFFYDSSFRIFLRLEVIERFWNVRKIYVHYDCLDVARKHLFSFCLYGWRARNDLLRAWLFAMRVTWIGYFPVFPDQSSIVLLIDLKRERVPSFLYIGKLCSFLLRFVRATIDPCVFHYFHRFDVFLINAPFIHALPLLPELFFIFANIIMLYIYITVLVSVQTMIEIQCNTIFQL